MNNVQLINSVEAPKAPSTLPIPLPSPMPPVAQFDPDMLPKDLRDYVMDVAKRQQCPPDFCAVSAITCLSALVGRKVGISPKQEDDQWIEFPNVWAALIGGPSSMKSPSLREMKFPLNDIESELRKQHTKTLAELKHEAKLQKLERLEIEQSAKKHIKNGNRNAALLVLKTQDNEDIKEPTPPRIVVNDSTVEALGERLNENPNGLLLIRDELSGWLSKMSQEEFATDRAFYLEAFNGKDEYIYDRIGRGTVRIENCMISVLGGIQPSKIKPVVREAANGVTDDGLIQRIQLAVWPDPIQDWSWLDIPVNQHAKMRYLDVFKRLHNLPSEPQPNIWHFSESAQKLFIEWMKEIQAEARSGQLPQIMESHLLKMPKTVSGIALVFALVNGDKDQVSLDSTAMALDWADYLRTHATRLYSSSIYAEIHAAHTILRKSKELDSPFTSREVYRKGWSGMDKQVVNEALELLVDHNFLIANDVSTGGRPKMEYIWRNGING